MNATLYTDGACLGNPGPMGLGIVLQLPAKTIEQRIPAGEGTNNIAEYTALIRGLELAEKHAVDNIAIFLDSELVVRQVNGEWNIRDEKLRPLATRAQALLKQFTTAHVQHIPREENSRADTLSKQAAADNNR